MQEFKFPARTELVSDSVCRKSGGLNKCCDRAIFGFVIVGQNWREI
jgi:hypothetical protein